jgi:hypothetical protein
MTVGATAYSVGGETPSIPLRQKTYAINIMSATAVSCLVLQVMPYLINSDELNLGGKSKSMPTSHAYHLLMHMQFASSSLPSLCPCASTFTSASLR